ncbi:hypothetical protein [Streptomyces flavofungini]|uniref:Uncharacterized protein n=1 Tax=Streptomyces flavofungini TaxID=68200 RepID=A0ABS0X769_9ACTN|nr:hypothetical protein [Streptomyces flavofungini]MBJ3809052.1 hypothetical protein [Streptomyces flavofungini]
MSADGTCADQGADPHVAWKEIAVGLTAVIDDPECPRAQMPTFAGPMPFGDSVESLPEDVPIHTWDLARATGGDLDAEAAAHVHAHLRPIDAELRRPWAFGPKVCVPPGVDARTEFLCFVGRQP